MKATRYIVFTEIHYKDGYIERWYFGRFNNRDKANEIAIELGNQYPIFHSVCAESDAEDFDIHNLPF